MENEKKTVDKTFTVVAKVKKSFSDKEGNARDYWEIFEEADENGDTPTHTIYSATLSEKIETGKEYRFQIEQGKNRGGYDQSVVKNVTEPGTEFPAIESRSKWQKNYQANTREKAIMAAIELIKLKYAEAKDWEAVATEVNAWIEKGKTDGQ